MVKCRGGSRLLDVLENIMPIPDVTSIANAHGIEIQVIKQPTYTVRYEKTVDSYDEAMELANQLLDATK